MAYDEFFIHKFTKMKEKGKKTQAISVKFSINMTLSLYWQIAMAFDMFEQDFSFKKAGRIVFIQIFI